MRLSPSSLSVLRDCRRCFWYEQVKKIKRPRGIYPSLPSGMDRALKRYVENSLDDKGEAIGGQYHLDGLKGARFYPNRDRVRIWQNNFKGLSCNVGEVAVHGAIDDLVQWPDGFVSPYDFKTRGAAPKPGQSELYYGTQLDIYHLLLEQDANLKCNGKGYLRYGWPKVVSAKTVDFEWETVTLNTDPSRAMSLVYDAAKVIDLPEPPDFNIKCEYCIYFEERRKQS